MRWFTRKGVRPALIVAVFLTLSIGGLLWGYAQTFPGGIGANPTVIRFPGGLRIQMGVIANIAPNATAFATYTGCTVTNLGIVATANTTTGSPTFAAGSTSAAGATITNISTGTASAGAFYIAACL